MSIKYVRIKNFQSWASVRFDLDKGINVFVGMSDRGKSAVLHAIQWVLTNKPLGDLICSDWGDKKEQNKRITRVDIMFNSGIEISRLKGKSVNEYRISTLDDPLETPGKGEPPQEVLDVFNMSEINIQTQDDPYFLFSESPAEIGRRLNKVASLSDIDVAFTNVASIIRSTKADRTACQSSLKRERISLTEYDYIDDAEKMLSELESKSIKLGALRTVEMNLRNKFNRIKGLQEKINNYDKVLTAKEAISKIEKKVEDLNNINLLLDKLEPVEKQLQTIKETIESANELISTEDDINTLLDIIDKIKEKEKYVHNLIEKKKQITSAEHVLKIATREEQTAIKEWTKAQPDICPLCEQGWKNEEK